jgi:hypothetical protein
MRGKHLIVFRDEPLALCRPLLTSASDHDMHRHPSPRTVSQI